MSLEGLALIEQKWLEKMSRCDRSSIFDVDE
jgi:hypothetical protein